jgi:hypothetical protein
MLADLRSLPGVKSAYLFGETIHAAFQPGAFDAAGMSVLLMSRGYDDVAVTEIQPDIEDCFIEAVDKLKNR